LLAKGRAGGGVDRRQGLRRRFINDRADGAGRSTWSNPNFAHLQVENLTKLTAEKGEIPLVEGEVLSAH
jgi:hypothetical protein